MKQTFHQFIQIPHDSGLTGSPGRRPKGPTATLTEKTRDFLRKWRACSEMQKTYLHDFECIWTVLELKVTTVVCYTGWSDAEIENTLTWAQCILYSKFM